MKKLVVFALVIVMLMTYSAFFVSCSAQIEEGRYSYAECDAEWVDEISGSQKKELAEAYGYENKKDYISEKTANVSEAFLGSSFVFNNDGTGEFWIANQKEIFTWKQDGKKIDIDFDGNEASIIFGNTDFEISSGDLVAQVHDVENLYALTIILTYKLK